ncbi:single-stranded-DNA-specific exonuclease RecJ [Leptolyngbya sp. FACHB-261]|uniref:single-stranded-DNA-specific exonuclease RecJ n=1 Tax=Leptolyngbya sp. FACHB-261 TaxID=2692806 RepID=UPI001686AE1A|nr:single-stranded-DNA-specific exonuclease RecJ [Leptolyngbya sp. FACHB-261]MBD2102284.1 single-stranded-DNA-specific exonuclease RecJ [Leptolyngbya sp. FACHB-261]
MSKAVWQLPTPTSPPEWLVSLTGHRAAQLLWRRGLRTPEQVRGFLSPDAYTPSPATALGDELELAVERLVQAHRRGERVAIWGDFDADGVTATSVLWDGLGQFFAKDQQLTYTIPNRLKESHGLHAEGLTQLAAAGYSLLVTCDTGSNSPEELKLASTLGLDVIVTDHHALPPERPPVAAFLNPRALEPDHPLAHLSGVAVAYKLVEALYLALPEVPRRPLTELLDLVAIGLIADLVNLQGDCRYLAQRGIARLQQQTSPNPSRPGLALLLEACRRAGDRPTDIAYGIGPRINAVSRIQGDARFCVELLTSDDPRRCRELVQQTELANTRRKGLQHFLALQVHERLANLDLSTTGVVLLAESGWPLGILGLVAGQIAQEIHRPTLLLSLEPDGRARGSARSVAGVDLYALFAGLEPLLERFGGHPLAVGLQLPQDNIPLLQAALNQRLQPGTLSGNKLQTPPLAIDLELTVAELAEDGGRSLFQELKQLEPCGQGNPAPKLLIRRCTFEGTTNPGLRDAKGQKVGYVQTRFTLRDATGSFPGVWWGHYVHELPPGGCDAVVELEYNANAWNSSSRSSEKRYEVRLVAVRPAQIEAPAPVTTEPGLPTILDWRTRVPDHPEPALRLAQCPTSWEELRERLHHAALSGLPLALVYQLPIPDPQPWPTLVGLAKYLARTGKPASLDQLQARLGIGPTSLALGLKALSEAGFSVTQQPNSNLVEIGGLEPRENQPKESIAQFSAAVREEAFQYQYFYQLPLSAIQAKIHGWSPIPIQQG